MCFLFQNFEKRKSRSYGKRQKGNDKRERYASNKSNTSLKDLSTKLREHGRHAMLSFLSSLPIPVLCILDIEAYPIDLLLIKPMEVKLCIIFHK